MAFKKTQSTSFNPASIQVNRGQGARQLGASIGELGTANSRGVNNFINNRLNEMEDKEKKLGKKLGQQAEIIYEDQTYTDATGNTRTHKVAVNYKTPEELLTTSWSASAYDEEAADTYVKAVVLNASQILDDEKLLARQNVKYTDTVGEHIAMFDKSVAEPIEALLSTVPSEMRSIVETEINDAVRTRRTDLANKQLTRRVAFNDATAESSRKQFANIAPSLALTNTAAFAEQLAKITKQMTTLSQKSDNPSSVASFWLQEELPTYLLMAKTGENLKSYILHDNKDSRSITRASNNIQKIRMGINNPAQVITLDNLDGTTTDVTLKSLGFGDIDGLDTTKIDSFLKNHKTYLDDMYTQSSTSEKSTNILQREAASGYPIVKTKKEYNALADALSDFNSPESEITIAEFALSFNPPREHYTSEYFTQAQQGAVGQTPTASTADIAMYYEWLAANHAVIPTNLGGDLKSRISDVQTGAANNVAIENLVNSPAFALMQSSVVMKDGVVDSRGIMQYLDLPENAEATIESLTKHITNNAGNVEAGVEAYMLDRNLKNEDGYYFKNRETLNKAYNKKNSGGDSFLTVLESAISNEFADMAGMDDVMVSNNFAKRITEQVYLHYRMENNIPSASQLEDKAIKIGKKMLETNHFGQSKLVISNTQFYTKGTGGGPFGIFEEELGEDAQIVQWPIDHFFYVNPERQEYNKRFKQKYGEEIVGSKTQVHRMVQDTINQRIQKLNPKNKGLRKGDELILGETVFFECINKHNITRPEQAVYQLKYINKSSGLGRTVYDDNDNPITYSQKMFADMYEKEEPYLGATNELSITRQTSIIDNLGGPNTGR